MKMPEAFLAGNVTSLKVSESVKKKKKAKKVARKVHFSMAINDACSPPFTRSIGGT